MSTLASYLSEREEAGRVRAKVFETTRTRLKELGYEFFPTNHFLTRFDQRAVSPLSAVRNFDIAMRCVHLNFEKIKGKQAAIKVGSYVYIINASQKGVVRAITFWFTEESPEKALKGRGDILFNY